MPHPTQESGCKTEQGRVLARGTIDSTLFEASLRHLQSVSDTAELKITENGVRIGVTNGEDDDTELAGWVILSEDGWESFDYRPQTDAFTFGFSLSTVHETFFSGNTLSDPVQFMVTGDTDTPALILNGKPIPAFHDSYPSPPENIPLPDSSATVVVSDGYRVRDWLRGKSHDVTTLSAHESYADDGYVRTDSFFSLQPRLRRGDFDMGRRDVLQNHDTLLFSRGSPAGADPDIEDFELNSKWCEALVESEGSPLYVAGSTQKTDHMWANYKTEHLKQFFNALLKEHTEGVSYAFEFGHNYPLRITRTFDDIIPDSNCAFTGMVSPEFF